MITVANAGDEPSIKELTEKAGLQWELITFTPDDPGFEKATRFVRFERELHLF